MEKKRINKLVVPLTIKSLSLLGAFTIVATSIVGCTSKKNKNNTSDTSSIVTSSNEEENKTDIDVITSDESITTEEIKEEDVVSSEITNNSSNTTTNSNQSSTNTKPNETKPSTNNNQTSNTTNNNQTSSNNTTSQSNKNEQKEEQILVSDLTIDNVNNLNVFKKIAADFRRSSIPGSVSTTFYYKYEGQQIETVGDKEFEVALMLLNYDYINTDIINNIIGSMSQEEFQKNCQFIKVILGVIDQEHIEYKFDKYCVNKALGKDLNNLVKSYINRNTGATFQEGVNSFYKKHPIGQESPWVDKLFFMMGSNAYSKLINIELVRYFNNNYSAAEKNFDNFILNVYNDNKNKVKTKYN